MQRHNGIDLCLEDFLQMLLARNTKQVVKFTVTYYIFDIQAYIATEICSHMSFARNKFRISVTKYVQKI